MAVILWLYFTPSLSEMKNFHYNWIIYLLIRNLIITVIVCGGLHLFLYIKKTQGIATKYNSKWPEKNSKNFLFNNQTKENIFWTLCSGVPIWTAYEVFALWSFSNGYFIYYNWNTNPIYLALIFLLIPLVSYPM